MEERGYSGSFYSEPLAKRCSDRTFPVGGELQFKLPSESEIDLGNVISEFCKFWGHITYLNNLDCTGLPVTSIIRLKLFTLGCNDQLKPDNFRR